MIASAAPLHRAGAVSRLPGLGRARREDGSYAVHAARLPPLRRGAGGDPRRFAPSRRRSSSRGRHRVRRRACIAASSSGSRWSRWTARSSPSWSWTEPRRCAVALLDTVRRMMGTPERDDRRPGAAEAVSDGVAGRRRPPLARRRGAALALPPGPDPGPQDGQGDDLLAGARRVHAHQLDPDPPRPLGLRQVRQARRRLQRRLAGRRRSARSCGPRASTTSRCSAPATSARRSRARTSSPTTASRSSPIFDVDSEAGRQGARRRRGPRPSTTSSASSRSEDVVVGVLAVPVDAAQEVADRLVEAGVQDHLQLLRAAAAGAAGRDRPHLEPRGRPALRALLLPGLDRWQRARSRSARLWTSTLGRARRLRGPRPTSRSGSRRSSRSSTPRRSSSHTASRTLMAACQRGRAPGRRRRGRADRHRDRDPLGAGRDFADAAASSASGASGCSRSPTRWACALAAMGTHPWANYLDQQIIDTEHYHRLRERAALGRAAEQHLEPPRPRRRPRRRSGGRGLRPPARAAAAAARRCRRTRRSSTATTPGCTRCAPRSSPARSRAAGSTSRSATGRPTPDFVDAPASGRTRSSRPTQLWWSVRPHHAFGTVEVRICDAQTRGDESFDLAGSIAACVAQARARLRRGRAARAAAAAAGDRGEPLARDPLGDGRRDDRLRRRRRRSRPRPRSSGWSSGRRPPRPRSALEVELPERNGAQRARRRARRGRVDRARSTARRGGDAAHLRPEGMTAGRLRRMEGTAAQSSRPTPRSAATRRSSAPQIEEELREVRVQDVLLESVVTSSTSPRGGSQGGRARPGAGADRDRGRAGARRLLEPEAAGAGPQRALGAADALRAGAPGRAPARARRGEAAERARASLRGRRLWTPPRRQPANSGLPAGTSTRAASAAVRVRRGFVTTPVDGEARPESLEPEDLNT